MKYYFASLVKYEQASNCVSASVAQQPSSLHTSSAGPWRTSVPANSKTSVLISGEDYVFLTLHP